MADKSFLCVYSTSITSFDSSLNLLMRLMEKFGEKVEKRQIPSQFFPDKFGDFFSVTLNHEHVNTEFLFWVLSSDGYNINKIREFSLPLFNGVIYIIIAPQTFPDSFESLTKSYLTTLREEFLYISRFFDSSYQVTQNKLLILYLHRQETFISLKDALGDDLFENLLEKIPYIDCPIENLDEIGSTIVSCTEK